VILIDTSIWIDHLHHSNSRLTELLESRSVATHPLVLAELALGSLRNRHETLTLIGRLPHVQRVSDAQLLTFIDSRRLWSNGLSVVDVSLLASVLITPDTRLWSHDKRLAAAATQLGVAWPAG
jgi:predicted nucleic acid-binding protein